jgi:hypothetical protein
MSKTTDPVALKNRFDLKKLQPKQKTKLNYCQGTNTLEQSLKLQKLSKPALKRNCYFAQV